jgi:cell division protein FtsZ
MGPGDQKIFEVKDRSVVKDNIVEPEKDATGVEINLFSLDDDFTDEQRQQEIEKTKERMQQLKKTHGHLKENKRKNEKDDNIDELEDEPAYIRKKIKLDKEKKSSVSRVSRYSLTEDDEKNIELNDDNAYLHDNVD